MKIISLLFFTLVLACSQGSNKEYAINEVPSEDTYAGDEFEEMVVADASNTQETIPTKQPQQIIKTAQLTFASEDPETTRQRILSLIQKQQGFVQNDVSGQSYNRVYRRMAIRIPTKNFNAFVEKLSEGVSYFDTKDISRKDVTEEFVDLNARLKAKRELENRYLALLKEAKNVKEMLDIERELSKIREEIEAKQGRLTYLKDQVSMSTVQVEFYKYTSETGVTVSYGQKMKNAFKGGWDGISVFFLGILYLWPLFLLGLIIFVIIRYYLKRKKKN